VSVRTPLPTQTLSSWAASLSATNGGQPGPPPTDTVAPPQEGGEDPPDGFWEKFSRGVGSAGKVISKIPRALGFLPRFLQFAVFDAALPLITFTATLGGYLGGIGIGAAGVLEVIEGVRKKDNVQVFSGAGELSRGVFVGTALAAAAMTPSPLASSLAHTSDLFSYASGAIGIAMGAARIRRGMRTHNRDEKIVGALEAGIGVCTLVASSGAMLFPALAVQAVLATARFGVANRKTIATTSRKIKRQGARTWRNFKALFKREKETAPTPTAPSIKSVRSQNAANTAP